MSDCLIVLAIVWSFSVSKYNDYYATTISYFNVLLTESFFCVWEKVYIWLACYIYSLTLWNFLQVMLVICQVRCFVGCSKHVLWLFIVLQWGCAAVAILVWHCRANLRQCHYEPSPCCRLVPAAHSQQTFLTLPKSDDEISLPDTIVFDYEAGYMIFGTVMCEKADYVSSASLDWCRFPLGHCPLLTLSTCTHLLQTNLTKYLCRNVYQNMYWLKGWKLRYTLLISVSHIMASVLWGYIWHFCWEWVNHII